MREQLRKALTHAVTAYGIDPSMENYTRVMDAHDEAAVRAASPASPEEP